MNAHYKYNGCEQRQILERELTAAKLELDHWSVETAVYLPNHFRAAEKAVSFAKREIVLHKRSCELCREYR